MAYQNFYATKLSNAIGASDVTITVQTPPTVTSGRLVLEPRNSTYREVISFSGVTGNQLTGVVRGLYGTSAQPHTAGVLIEMNFLAADYQDLVDAFNTFSGTNGSGWFSTAQTASIVATNGNRSFDISIPTDLTGVLSKGMRLKIPRTGTAVQTQVTSLNGTNQYWSKTTPAGMTFTDDFVAGAWIKITAYPASTGTIMSRYNGTSGWILDVTSTGQIRLLGYNAGAANVSYVYSYQSVPLNKWVHVAAQLDMSAFTATTTTSYVMIDGVDVPASVTRAGTNPTALVQAGNLEVGSTNGGTTAFGGKIAQAFVSSAKITQANVRGFMNANITNAIASANSIISAYSFGGNGNDGNTTNANNLTAQNSAAATNADSPFNANAYAIIMSTPAFGANTTMTVQTPEGYPIPNATLGTASFSAVRSPYGFPSRSSAWDIEALMVAGYSAANSGNLYLKTAITLPVGEHNLGYDIQVKGATAAATTHNARYGLGTTAGAAVDSTDRLTAAVAYVSITEDYTSAHKEKAITISTPTTYYLNASSIGTAFTDQGLVLSPSVIYARNALL